MRLFARPFPIDRLSLEARVLYTSFLVFVLAGIGSSVWLYRDSFRSLGTGGVADYYLGGAAPAGPAGSAPGPAATGPKGPTGPALDLPDAGGAELRLEKAPRQLWETFHFHLFTVPVVLLIVGHLFMLTSVATRWKVALLAAAAGGALAHLVAPLAVRFGGAGWAPLLPASAVLAGLAWLPLCAWPVVEMWWPRGEGDGPGPPPEAES